MSNFEQLSAQVQTLQTQVNSLNFKLRGLDTAATARATETYERKVRSDVFRDLVHVYGQDPKLLSEVEKVVRYIVDGPKE